MDGDSGHRVGEAGFDGGHAGQVVLQIGALVVAPQITSSMRAGSTPERWIRALHHRMDRSRAVKV